MMTSHVETGGSVCHPSRRESKSPVLALSLIGPESSKFEGIYKPAAHSRWTISVSLAEDNGGCSGTVIGLSLFLSACGSSIEGAYSGENAGFLDQIEIKDDQKVELMFMGSIREGTFEVQVDRVRRQRLAASRGRVQPLPIMQLRLLTK